MLDSRGTRTVAQGLEKGFGKLQIDLHPALARRVRQVEVQPEELLRRTGGVQAAQGYCRVDLLTRLAGTEHEAIEQAMEVGVPGTFEIT